VSLTLGQRMTRLEDGVEGVVRMEGNEPRIVYSDRGTLMIAGKHEKWIPFDIGQMRLRPEEIIEVAIEADRALRAIERHEPRRYWEPLKRSEIYDQGLVDTISAYLAERQ